MRSLNIVHNIGNMLGMVDCSLHNVHHWVTYACYVAPSPRSNFSILMYVWKHLSQSVTVQLYSHFQCMCTHWTALALYTTLSPPRRVLYWNVVLSCTTFGHEKELYSKRFDLQYDNGFSSVLRNTRIDIYINVLGQITFYLV